MCKISYKIYVPNAALMLLYSQLLLVNMMELHSQ
uniref:Uncharacterized protein n=1 Tax=Rhizophora mucronata TaxID=61149 RepID=A0A2P2PW89_RHIMU